MLKFSSFLLSKEHSFDIVYNSQYHKHSKNSELYVFKNLPDNFLENISFGLY